MDCKRRRIWAAFFCNAAIVVMEIVSAFPSTRTHGFKQFQYYTQDSNYLAMICSAVYAVFLLRSLLRGKAVPRWAETLHYLSVCCLCVTFLVVLFVLAPIPEVGFRIFIVEAMLYQHLLCPVVATLSFLLFERPFLSRYAPFAAWIPTILYAIVSTTMNVARLWYGPYPFLLVYEQPIYMSVLWAILIPFGALTVAWLLYLPKRPKTIAQKTTDSQ